MAVSDPLNVVDDHTSGTNWGGASGALTFEGAYVVSSGSNLALFVELGDRQLTATITVTSDLDGDFTQVGTGVANGRRFQRFILLNPTVGTHSLSFDSSTEMTGSNRQWTHSIFYMTGVHQTTAYGTPVTDSGTGTSGSATVTDQSTGDKVLCGGVIQEDEAVSAGTNETKYAEDQFTGTNQTLFGVHQDGADGGAMTPSWTSSVAYAMQAVTIFAAAAGVNLTAAVYHQRYHNLAL